MILDLDLKNKQVVIVGGGPEAHRKIMSFLDAGSKILVVSQNFLDEIHNLHELKKIELCQKNIKDANSFIGSFKQVPDVLVAVTNDHELNAQLVKRAKTAGSMVYAVDNTKISDFMLPALAKIDDVRIAVSTSGKSPSMARVLRQRIEKMITKQDLLQIKLQEYVRGELKQMIPDQKIRKIVMTEILQDTHIQKMLKKGDMDQAKQFALDITKSFQEPTTNHTEG
ncbi:MAG: bifunctional precorrin-2 dehydrogenase/sirohydrochlorin ferrochelatase [Candidatus Bathyarchaeota archaeon]|nr:MAG: bifunctional precorrin-2 dehydrogenase/sirohydrochlorin ferrochelatase [Candidatus Bathyarchaeum tardum]WNZ28911.1 MAG: bifunctional precorrin-2 dehydrogenase/sirohydrochlorin ferrochelatase [Candidatus Bathyarchaeota archaeon]